MFLGPFTVFTVDIYYSWLGSLSRFPSLSLDVTEKEAGCSSCTVLVDFLKWYMSFVMGQIKDQDDAMA